MTWHTIAGADPEYSARGALIVLGLTINAAFAQNFISVAAVVVLGAAFIWVQVDQRIRQNLRDQKRLDVEAALEIQTHIDKINHESLTAQLEEVQKTLDATKADGETDRKRLRDTQHRIVTELQASRLETDEIRAALVVSHESCVALSTALSEAHCLIAELQGVPLAKGAAPSTPHPAPYAPATTPAD